MSGFKTKNKHTKDFDLRMIERQAPHPTDQEIKEEVPGHQGDVDFSLMFGEPIRKNRELSYVFKLTAEKRSDFRFQKTVLENWLLDGKKDRIYDDDEMKYYYYEIYIIFKLLNVVFYYILLFFYFNYYIM